MAKAKSFADKMSSKKHEMICQTCEAPIENVLVMEPTNDNPKGSWKLRERFVGVCKCNQKEVYG